MDIRFEIADAAHQLDHIRNEGCRESLRQQMLDILYHLDANEGDILEVCSEIESAYRRQEVA